MHLMVPKYKKTPREPSPVKQRRNCQSDYIYGKTINLHEKLFTRNENDLV